jgi:hypothetical protein
MILVATTVTTADVAAAAAVTVTVNTTSATSTLGDGHCSLEEAVSYADGTAEPDCAASAAPAGTTTTINLPAGQFTVPSPLKLLVSMNLVGAGQSSTDIDGGGTTEVIDVSATAAVVAVSNLEISGGDPGTSTAGCSGTLFNYSCPAEPGYNGGGVTNNGNLTLENVLVSGNRAGDGAGPVYPLVRSCPCAGGDGDAGGDGGGIYNTGTLSVENSTISGNFAGAGGRGADGVGTASAGGAGGAGGGGGGVWNSGQLTITNSTVDDNGAGDGGAGGTGGTGAVSGDNGGNGGYGGSAGDGGALYTTGITTITGSTLATNHAGDGGHGGIGGVSGGGSGVNGASRTNFPDGFGGGMYQLGAVASTSAQLTDDTIFGNSAGDGGGIVSYDALALNGVTIAGNTAQYDGGIFALGAVERDSIIASNSAESSANCANGIAPMDGGHNIVYGDSNCPGTNANPRLGPLASNGGLTQTLALGAGSAAIDLVPASQCALLTDQRGVGRPQGGACDAGAYESAPPILTGLSATGSGPQSAVVAGQVTANLTDAKVTVDYGTSTAYGSSTNAIDAGAGLGAAPFSVQLSGLAPGTTYHAKVIVTNTDGTTSSNDLQFKTASTAADVTASGPAKINPDIVALKVSADAITVALSCPAGTATCSGKIELTSRVTTKRGKVIAVAASARPKRKTHTETVGAGSYSVPPGQTKALKFTLNATGRRLLKARHRLPAIAKLTGAVTLSRAVTFVYVKPKVKKHR